MIALRKIITLLLTAVFLLAALTFGASAADGVTVDIVSFSRGAQADLRSSELLEARVSGYSGNVRELTYEWSSTIGTYLYVYNNHNMYGINNTDGEIEIYNSDKGMGGSANMSGRTYNETFKGTGYAWAAIYGASVSQPDLDGTITVKVYDADGNLLATDSHVGVCEETGSFLWWATYENKGILPSDLGDDVNHVRFGLFEGDTKNVKILLGESSIVHITCAECSVSEPTVTQGKDIIALEVDKTTQEWYIKSVQGTSNGEAKVQITIKKGNCKFHQNVSATREIEVFVYKKPTTTSTATAIMLDNLDDNCKYYIGGVMGEKKTVDGKEYVVFENLTPNTQYQIEVVGQAEKTEPVYAYVYETTKPAHVGTVNVILDGTYTASGKPVNIEAMMPEVETLYLRYENSEIYFPLDNTATGVYSSELSDGNYTLYYSVSGSEEKIKLDNQILTVSGASKARNLFFNSVNYDTNGGTPKVPTEYHLASSKVAVSDVVPSKEGYLFTHWTCKDGHTHKTGDVLTESITEQYNLVAQYIEATDVYVNIVIDHTAGSGINNADSKNNVDFSLYQRLNAGEFNKIGNYSVKWDGESEFSSEYFTVAESDNVTTYTAKAPLRLNVAKNAEYNLTSNKSGYNLTSVKSNLVNGKWYVNATFKYNPNNFDIVYTVELDENAKKVADEWKPVAVNVKVTTWSDPINVAGNEIMWYPISQHTNTYERVVLDKNGFGKDTYPVWIATTGETSVPYYYRIEVVSYETADGTIIPAINVNGANTVYETEQKRYSAKIQIDGGAAPSGTDLHGAYYANGAQVGTINALVSINVYDVTLVPNGGTLNGTAENTVLEDVLTIPNLKDYVPTRDGGYVFEGWYVADENGNITEEKPLSNAVITKDTTLIAKWRAPLTIQGYVRVAGTYTINENGVEVKHEIHGYDRLNSVYVFLQRVAPNGDTETVKYIEAPVNSPRFEGDYGTAAYKFTGIEDIGEQYRIMVGAVDYNTYYNNDTSSISFETIEEYKSESEDDLYLAAFTNDDTINVANVYAYLEFEPKSFDLKYQVDSAFVGDGFKPAKAEVLVLYDTGERVDPQSWTPISQMVYGDSLAGNVSEFENNIASGSEPVWNTKSSTGALYDYSIRVKALTFGDEVPKYDSLPYYITYNGSARYSEANNGQTQLLTATVYPRMYTLTFDMGNLPENVIVEGMDKYATINRTFEDSFYWSFGTEITALPTADGFTFLGWFDADGNEVTVIPADTANDVKVTAKWSANVEFDVMADAGYYAENRNAAEKVGTIAFNARVKNIDAAKNIISTFGIFVYDLTGSTVRVKAENADMAQLVNDNGEFHIIISDIAVDNFDKKVMAAPYVVVNGEIIMGAPMNITVSQTQKWLGANAAQ